MYKKNVANKHYSLSITLTLFIAIMASIVTLSSISSYKSQSSRIVNEISYSNLEMINPLLLEDTEHVLDKTNHNIELTQEIDRVYNIDVIYGDGTEYLAESVNAEAIYNSEEVNSMLLELIECLEKYPSNIFKEIELKDYTIEICFVEYFNNDNVALATRDSNNNFKIYLSNIDNSQKVQRAVHHETYHVLEYYMKLEYDINELYKDWKKYNPEGFEYQSNIAMLDTNYVYNYDKNGEAYFVSIYSKVSDKEDRAEVFADTMISPNMPLYYNDNLGAIKNKMNLISNVMKHCFYSVEYNNSIYWTRYF